MRHALVLSVRLKVFGSPQKNQILEILFKVSLPSKLLIKLFVESLS